jgi:hypothetical protein
MFFYFCIKEIWLKILDFWLLLRQNATKAKNIKQNKRELINIKTTNTIFNE